MLRRGSRISVSHHRTKLETDQPETDDAEGGDRSPFAQGRKEPRDAGKRVKALASRAGEGGRRDREEDQRRAYRPHASEVVHPLPYSEAAQVERGETPEERHGEREHEAAVIGQGHEVRPADVDGNPDEVEEERRYIEDVVGPVTPAADESVGVTEELPRPEMIPPSPGYRLANSVTAIP